MKNNRHFFILSGAIVILFACLGFWIYFLTNSPHNIFSADPEPIIPTVELGLFVALLIVGIRTLFRGAFACGLTVLVACVGFVMVADQLTFLWEIGALGFSDGCVYNAALAGLLIVIVSLTSEIKQWRWPGWVSPLVQRGFLALVLASAVILSALYLTTNRPGPVATEQVRTFTQDGVQFQVSGPAIVQIGQPVEMTIRLTNNRPDKIWYPDDPRFGEPANELQKLIVKSYFRGFYEKAVPTTASGKYYWAPQLMGAYGKDFPFLLPGQTKEWKVDFNQLVILDRGFYLASFNLGFDGERGVLFGDDKGFPCGIDHIGLEVR
jgi:hypothetical protein